MGIFAMIAILDDNFFDKGGDGLGRIVGVEADQDISRQAAGRDVGNIPVLRESEFLFKTSER